MTVSVCIMMTCIQSWIVCQLKCYRLFCCCTHTHATILRLCGFCPVQPGWDGTRRNIHPLTLIVVINRPYLLSPSTTIHGILRIQSTCSTVFFHNLSPSFLWSTSWPGTLHFILHTPIIVFFLQHMPYSVHVKVVVICVCWWFRVWQSWSKWCLKSCLTMKGNASVVKRPCSFQLQCAHATQVCSNPFNFING